MAQSINQIDEIVPRVKDVEINDSCGVDTGMSSDDSESSYKPFNLREYEKNEKNEYTEYVQGYEQERCDRYLETIERRRKKMAIRHLTVLESLFPRVFLPTKTPLQKAEEEKAEPTTAFSWNNIQPIAPLAVDALEPVVITEHIEEQPKQHVEKRKKKEKKEESDDAKDVSDEEMMKAMKKRIGSRSPQSGRKSQQQSPHQQPSHQTPLQPNNQSRIRVFSVVPKSTTTNTPPSSHQTGRSPVTQTHPPVSNKTRMCNFRNCKRPGCGYAHSMTEFDPVHCKFNDCKRANCRFFHSGKETKEEYLVRFRSSLQSSS